MKIRIEILSNTILGSGKSIPGGEDIGLLVDSEGFPYLRGSTFKGILREEIENIIDWEGEDRNVVEKLFGTGGERGVDESQLVISDFTLSDNVKNVIRKKDLIKERVTECFSSVYTFTSIENGVAKKGSLRTCRYINKGIVFHGNILCCKDDEEILRKGLKAIKYIGTMRTRGFGRVKVREE